MLEEPVSHPQETVSYIDNDVLSKLLISIDTDIQQLKT